MLLNPSVVKDQINSTKIKPIERTVPKYILTIIHELNLQDIDNHNTRAKILIQHLYSLNRLSGTTISNIYNKLKPVFFPNSTIEPNQLVFDVARSNCMQTRGINFDDLQLLIPFIENRFYGLESTNDKEFKILASIIFAIYTGLRLNEIPHMRYSHLIELKNQKTLIYMKRKTSTTWEVFYFDKLIHFINHLCEKLSHELSILTSGIDDFIFKKSNRTLHTYLQIYYRMCLGKEPNIGFGIHTFRYYLATKLFQSGSLEHARLVLGHKNQVTTHRYLRVEDATLQNELNTIDIDMYQPKKN